MWVAHSSRILEYASTPLRDLSEKCWCGWTRYAVLLRACVGTWRGERMAPLTAQPIWSKHLRSDLLLDHQMVRSMAQASS